MEKKLFSVFFLFIPILSVILLATHIMRSDDFWSAFESSLPIIIFYYLTISVLWVINLDKIKREQIFMQNNVPNFGYVTKSDKR